MKTVLLGITGCIAAYKACEIVRGLQKARDDIRVKVVMTEHACEFVGPTTFRALTHEEVACGLFDNPSDPIHHISLASEADVFCIAPATANVIAKIATGRADDLLTTTALATKAPLMVAPAMNTGMWTAEATRENMRTLASRSVDIISPETGELACKTVGEGRLAAPSVIVDAILRRLDKQRDLEGKKILITAGPTREPIDPVRYIGNRSSGKTGYAIAEEALARGAEVTLITGPTALVAPESARVIEVETAQQMLDAGKDAFPSCDAAIFVAAVADWRCVEPAREKIKHKQGELSLSFIPNPDVAATLAAEKGERRVVVFAAETGDPIDAARVKLESKHADLVVANDVSSPEIGFGSDDNAVSFVTHEGADSLGVLPKRLIAEKLLDRLFL